MTLSSAGFQHGRSETLGMNVSGTTAGTTVTASGSINTKGSWVSLGQTTFGWQWFNLCMAQTGASDKIIDIAVSDNNSTWFTIAQDIRFAGRKSADLIQSIALPIRIASGKYVAVRVAASSASHVVICSLIGSSVGMMGGIGYSRAIPLYTAATSRGVAVDPGGTANTKSTPTQLTASVSEGVDAIYVMIGHNADTTRTATASAALDIMLGASSAEYPIISNLLLRWTTTLDGPQINIGPLPCYIPKDTRLSARAQCTDITAGDRTMDVAVLGFIP